MLVDRTVQTNQLLGATSSSSAGVGAAAQKKSPPFVTEIPPGYRDRRLFSVAREEGDLDDIRAILGNDVAIKAYREGMLPFPEGTIIARLAWGFVASEENNKTLAAPNPLWPGSSW